MWIEQNSNKRVEGIKCNDACDIKPKEMKLRHFQNAISTYCDKVKPYIKGKRETSYYYKLKEACIDMFKPSEEDFNNNNIDGLLSDDEE